jgi:D-alanine-D-alanine ligase
MPQKVTIVYNEPQASLYIDVNKKRAVLDVLNAVDAVHKSLLELGHEVELLPLLPPFAEARKKLEAVNTEVVFNLFEGFCDEPETEPLVPETLEELGIPYTGCRADVLEFALDKARVKETLKEAGILTPEFQLLSPENLDTFGLDFPCIVKPRADDASNGITEDSLVNDFAALEKQVRFISESFRSGALVEHFLNGQEFNATVMGNAKKIILPVSEIVYTLDPDTPRILTYAAKWEPKSQYYKRTNNVCPAEVSAEEKENIANTAMSAYELVIGSGYARVDMRTDEDGKLNIIEVNPNPDISLDSGAARQSQAAGMSYAEFIGQIVNLALESDKDGFENTPHVGRRQAGADINT